MVLCLQQVAFCGRGGTGSGEGQDCCNHSAGIQIPLFHFIAVWLWAYCVTRLSLCFLICKWKWYSWHHGVVRIKWSHACECSAWCLMWNKHSDHVSWSFHSSDSYPQCLSPGCQKPTHHLMVSSDGSLSFHCIRPKTTESSLTLVMELTVFS